MGWREGDGWGTEEEDKTLLDGEVLPVTDNYRKSNQKQDKASPQSTMRLPHYRNHPLISAN